MAIPLSSLAEALRDRYPLERELGCGGMATVYLAQDLKHDRKIALKALHPERFLREIQLTARLFAVTERLHGSAQPSRRARRRIDWSKAGRIPI